MDVAKGRKSKLSLDELRQAAYTFTAKSQKIKRMQTQLAELKEQFYADASDYLECNDMGDSIDIEYVGGEAFNDFAGTLHLKKIQKASVEFNADAIEKALGKELSKEVILKRYEVQDMAALIVYLKECGVDPKIFKSFIVVEKSVDAEAIDRLEEVGRITHEQIDGCYTVKTQNPYFTVKVKRGQGDKD